MLGILSLYVIRHVIIVLLFPVKRGFFFETPGITLKFCV